MFRIYLDYAYCLILISTSEFWISYNARKSWKSWKSWKSSSSYNICDIEIHITIVIVNLNGYTLLVHLYCSFTPIVKVARPGRWGGTSLSLLRRLPKVSIYSARVSHMNADERAHQRTRIPILRNPCGTGYGGDWRPRQVVTGVPWFTSSRKILSTRRLSGG